MDIKKKLKEVERNHGYNIVDETHQGTPVKTIVCACGNRYGLGQSHINHVVEEHYKVVAEAQAVALDVVVEYLRKCADTGISTEELIAPIRRQTAALHAEARD